MLTPGVYLEAYRLCAALARVGHHAEDSLLNDPFGMGLAEFGRSGYNLIANIAGVAGVDLGAFLVAGKDDFVRIDDDDIITAVHVRGEDSLVLSTQQVSCCDADLTEYLVGSVDNIPLALNILGFGREGFHMMLILIPFQAFANEPLSSGRILYPYLGVLSIAFCEFGHFFSKFRSGNGKSACQLAFWALN